MQGIKSAFDLYKEMKEKKGADREAVILSPKLVPKVSGKQAPSSKDAMSSGEKMSFGSEKITDYAGDRLALIETIYEKSRYQKLYGISAENEEHLTKECVSDLTLFIHHYPHVMLKIRLIQLLQDDRGNPMPAKYGEFFTILQDIMHHRATIKLGESTAWKISATVVMKARELNSLFDLFERVDLVQISLPNHSDPSDPSLPSTIIIFTEKAALAQRIRSEVYQIIQSQERKVNVDSTTDSRAKEFVHSYSKESRPPAITRPSDDDRDFILSHANLLFPWLKGRYATLQKIVYTKKEKRDELRFYRNSYKGGKHKIRFESPLVLEEQIALGAFAFIADSACSNTIDLPCGPYSACIDFDPSDTKISYDELLDYVFDFHSYFVNEIGIDPSTITWLHSGNNSFHVRIAVPEFDTNQYGLLLPKTHSFDTYYRRKKDEMNIQFLHDAVELLILKYNLDYTRLGRVSQRVPAFVDRSQFRLFADNRTVLHGGARVPLSWHTKSHLFCRVFDIVNIPDNAIELKYLCSRDYLKRHTQWLQLPTCDYSKNADAIFTATSEYLTKNFNKLTYKLQVWNGKMDPMSD